MLTVTGHAIEQEGTMQLTEPERIEPLNPAKRDEVIAAVQTVLNLSDDETIVYAALFDAAEHGRECPTGDELNDLTGRSSDSASRYAMDRLERKGAIEVSRLGNNRRQVLIVATGKTTKRDPQLKANGRHVPRGAKDPSPLILALRRAGVPCRTAIDIANDPLAARQFEANAARALDLISRRRDFGSIRRLKADQRDWQIQAEQSSGYIAGMQKALDEVMVMLGKRAR